MASVDGCLNVVVWDLRSGRVRRTIDLPDRASGSGALLSPDGRYVLVTVLGGSFVRVDLATGKSVVRPGAQTEGRALAISPNGRFYAIGRLDGTVDVYDARSLRLVRHHTLDHAIETLVFSPDSRELAVEDTRHVLRVWDTCDVCQNPRASPSWPGGRACASSRRASARRSGSAEAARARAPRPPTGAGAPKQTHGCALTPYALEGEIGQCVGAAYFRETVGPPHTRRPSGAQGGGRPEIERPHRQPGVEC